MEMEALQSGRRFGSYPSKGGESHAHNITYRQFYCDSNRETQQPPLCQVTVV